ncbi:hypothetical protein ABK040_013716 [Willaertia magna]
MNIPPPPTLSSSTKNCFLPNVTVNNNIPPPPQIPSNSETSANNATVTINNNNNQVTPPPPSFLFPLNNANTKSPIKKISTKRTPLDVSKVKNYPIDLPIDWGSIHNVALSGTGSTGVIFVEVVEGQVTVIKAGVGLANEMFAALVASKILNLRSPAMRLIEYSPPNFIKKKITNSTSTYTNYREWGDIKQQLEKWAIKHKESIIENKIKKELNRAFFFAMEFIEGSVSLETLMNDDDLANELLHNEVILNDIGKLIIFDIILNNCDRFPITGIWDHQGNEGNILFSKIEKRLCCIDAVCTSIIERTTRKGYCEKIKEFVIQTLGHEEETDDNFFTDYFTVVTGVSFDLEHKKMIWRGIKEATKLLKDNGFDKIVELKEQVEKLKRGSDWADVWYNSVLTIDLEFIKDVFSIITSDNV